MWAILPTCVFMPVSVTIPLPCPPVTAEAEKSRLWQSPMRCVLRENRVRLFAGRQAFPRQGAFFRLKAERFRHAQIGRHEVAGLENHKVARHKAGRRR